MPPTLQDLPKQYDHAAAQGRWYKFWLERGYFHSEPDETRERFSIVIPPPNVTGALHLGHALNNTLQDVLVRFRRMQGYNTLWMPGTDHAGIATQAVVERRLLEEEKKSRHDLGRAKLVERIWAWKNEYEARILGQLQQMGCSCDWLRTRFTFDDVCARAVRHTFFGMFKEGLIYRGKRLVNWDTFLQTAVSDDEVFHETVAGHFWHFRYPVIDPLPGEPAHVTIATTRPETMLGDTAVAVHPDPAAALAAAEEQLRAKLAESSEKDKPDVQAQLDELAERRKTILPLLLKLRDMALAGRKLRLPLLNREIPLVADEWAKPELGSGCVKITPAHDPNDYDVGLRQKLPMINILNPDGTLNANAGPYQSLTVAAARKRVVADLDAQGLVEKVEDREIELAHSDRSKTPIEPYLADQWFVKMQDLAQSAMDAVTSGRVKIVPPRYAKGYLDWLSEKRDWPVSRQLWWGHQIPVWRLSTADTADREGEPEIIEAAHRMCRRLRDKFPADFNFKVVFRPLVAPELDPEKWAIQKRAEATGEAQHESVERGFEVCLREDVPAIVAEIERFGFKRDPDVLDTWFSSALWPHSTLGWPEQTPELAYYYPTSVLVTNRDIITLWVARMVLTGLFNLGDVPFREVFIHPKILDGFGEGMSKSKGNGVDPLDIIAKFGADSLRFALAYLTTETQDVRMPVEFECPHCGTRIEQTKKNRVLPRIDCTKCHKPFGTQWASKPEDRGLARAPVVSERFELARNFCNKLWNASRFVLLNLEGYTSGRVDESQLTNRDRWILSRLASVTQSVTQALETYRYADAARVLYDFAWNEFCSNYIESIKTRLDQRELQESGNRGFLYAPGPTLRNFAAERPVAQRIIAHVLDQLLRLLHPFTPFVTEEVWQLLGTIAPKRGLDDEDPPPAAESIMIANWPTCDAAHLNKEVEAENARFFTLVGALREFRMRENVGKESPINLYVRCDEQEKVWLNAQRPELTRLTKAQIMQWGPDTKPPVHHVAIAIDGMEFFLDSGVYLNEAQLAEWRAREEKELVDLHRRIEAKKRQLANEQFVTRAKKEVVDAERQKLAGLEDEWRVKESLIKALTESEMGTSGSDDVATL